MASCRGRGTTNLLTRTTAVLGTAFFALSLTLALLNRGAVSHGRPSILDVPPASAPASPLAAPAPATDAAPAVPRAPAVPTN